MAVALFRLFFSAATGKRYQLFNLLQFLIENVVQDELFLGVLNLNHVPVAKYISVKAFKRVIVPLITDYTP